MENQLVLFLGIVSVAFILNTVLIWCTYKAIATVTTKATKRMLEFERSGRTKAWIASLQTAAQEAADFTEATRRRMLELDPVMSRAKERYAVALVDMDSQLVRTADDISSGARKFRDLLAKPAFSFMTIAAGVNNVLRSWQSQDEDTDA